MHRLKKMNHPLKSGLNDGAFDSYVSDQSCKQVSIYFGLKSCIRDGWL